MRHHCKKKVHLSIKLEQKLNQLNLWLTSLNCHRYDRLSNQKSWQTNRILIHPEFLSAEACVVAIRNHKTGIELILAYQSVDKQRQYGGMIVHKESLHSIHPNDEQYYSLPDWLKVKVFVNWISFDFILFPLTINGEFIHFNWKCTLVTETEGLTSFIELWHQKDTASSTTSRSTVSK